MACKYVRLRYYRFYGFQFPNLFEAQSLTHLVKQKTYIYLDLIKVFYYNLRVRDGVATIKVKGVRIILDDDILTNMAMMTIWDDAVKVHLSIDDEANQDDADEDINAHMAEPVNEVDPSTAGPSVIPSSSSLSMEEHFSNLSRQMEEMSMLHQTRQEELLEMHQSHYSYVTERLEDFDIRLGNIKEPLNLQPPDQLPSPTF
ncbi:hypothetical protein LR48_Vigan03g129100 [Vigna angularis]|uniref:Uncharacterized protein n=1 Tax=Phaseolus angularis TaxID=3914 RepID=A0A0L9U663_PHAAN|nr:hypothetical protein LR48_Vigan03g129100 [Vigna angularis]